MRDCDVPTVHLVSAIDKDDVDDVREDLPVVCGVWCATTCFVVVVVVVVDDVCEHAFDDCASVDVDVRVESVPDRDARDVGRRRARGADVARFSSR